MVINTNVQAQGAAANLLNSQNMLAKSLNRLSSGSKITDPSDDAAGTAVAMRLDAQIKRLGAASSNVGNAMSFTQAQDGYLQKIGDALNRMSELSILAQDVTKSDTDRSLYNQEFNQLQKYITDTVSKDFNGVSLFSTNTLNVNIDSEGGTFPMGGINLGNTTMTNVIAGGTDIKTTADAITALGFVKSAISELASGRAMVGAYQSRLNITSQQLSVSKENITAASSRIQDVDVAEESTQYARYQILVQTGTAMLAQANSLPQSVLKLLQ
jgi:flagellin